MGIRNTRKNRDRFSMKSRLLGEYNMKRLLIILITVMLFACGEKKVEKTQVIISNVVNAPKEIEAKEDILIIPQKLRSKKSHKHGGGILEYTDSRGHRLILPLKQTDVKIDIDSGLAYTTVTQRFTNDTVYNLEAIYKFPLPYNAAITDMELRIGEKIVKSEVKEKQEAKRTYEQAKKAGKKTALLEQERENIFTTSVANFAANETVDITISYMQELNYKKGLYELNFPMVIGQRFIPYTLTTDKLGNIQQHTTVKDANRLNPPLLPKNVKRKHFLSLEVNIDGLDIEKIESNTHDINISNKGDKKQRITLAKGSTIPNSDFNIKIHLKSETTPVVSVLKSQKDGHIYSMLSVFPPKKIQKIIIPPRDVVFVIDTSGSMSGESIGQAKAGLTKCLEMLRPQDRFNIVRYSDDYSSFAPTFRDANGIKLNDAKSYIRELRSGGGTMLKPTLEYVFDMKPKAESIPIIILLTDGDVGNEDSLIKLVKNRLENRRLFTFGIGSAPNEILMKKIAEIGRGESRVIHSHEDISDVMTDFFESIESPILVDIELIWKDKAGKVINMETYPKKCSDLFNGKPIVAFTKSTIEVVILEVRGILNNKKVLYKFDIENSHRNIPTIDKMFGRMKIDNLSYKMIFEDNHNTFDELKKELIEVALNHQLISSFTSRVAVEYTEVEKNDKNGNLVKVLVPVELPKGWQRESFDTATNDAEKVAIGLFLLLAAFILNLVFIRKR